MTDYFSNSLIIQNSRSYSTTVKLATDKKCKLAKGRADIAKHECYISFALSLGSFLLTIISYCKIFNQKALLGFDYKGQGTLQGELHLSRSFSLQVSE